MFTLFWQVLHNQNGNVDPRGSAGIRGSSAEGRASKPRGRAGRRGGAAKGTGRPPSKPTAKGFRVPVGVQTDLPQQDLPGEAAGPSRVQQDHGLSKERQSEAMIRPLLQRVCMALFSSLHLIFFTLIHQEIVCIRRLLIILLYAPLTELKAQLRSLKQMSQMTSHKLSLKTPKKRQYRRCRRGYAYPIFSFYLASCVQTLYPRVIEGSPNQMYAALQQVGDPCAILSEYINPCTFYIYMTTAEHLPLINPTKGIS
jgi:hypothetical protein